MNDLSKIISLCKRRGFVFQSSDIYGGLQGVYDYGPLGVEIKNNLKAAWWKAMVYDRDDIEGIDSSILTHPTTLCNSGHIDTFSDQMIECKRCHFRIRIDEQIECPGCSSTDFTEPKEFNLMFKTNLGSVESDKNNVYLRPETAQGIFTNTMNVFNSTSRKMPFGIAQIGKAFRNEITARNFIFRMREFEQMEMEYFHDGSLNREELLKFWEETRFNWWITQGLNKDNLRIEKQNLDDLAHYSTATSDIQYKFPGGWDEIEGIADRGCFDASVHGICINGMTPFVIEPSAGVDRGILAILCEAYKEEALADGSIRTLLQLKPHLAPIKFAVIPLAKNKPEIVDHCHRLVKHLRKNIIGRIKYEDIGNIGKAYRRNDEIGTPYCITVDFQTLEDQTVTIRNRDTMIQTRFHIKDLLNNL